MSDKVIIGRETLVSIAPNISEVPAKIDTGADGSAIWASGIYIDKEGRLCFKLFDEPSPFYTGETIKTKSYSVAHVKSASGDITIKFRTHLSITIKGRKIKVLFGLCDRSTHNYPILIGRRTLNGKFLVDVQQHENIMPKRIAYKSKHLTDLLRQDPHDFYKNYYLNGAIPE